MSPAARKGYELYRTIPNFTVLCGNLRAAPAKNLQNVLPHQKACCSDHQPHERYFLDRQGFQRYCPALESARIAQARGRSFHFTTFLPKRPENSFWLVGGPNRVRESVSLLSFRSLNHTLHLHDGPGRDTDTFEIAIPDGYVVDDIPEPVDADCGFASYHSKTEVKGNVIDYKRTFEVKELSVPVSRADELKKFYRVIAGDERSTVVLRAVNK